MTVSLIYFGVLKDLIGQSTGSVRLPENATVSDLLGALPGNQASVWKMLAVAVNREYAGLTTVLHEGDEVALLPPVSGGAL